MGLALLAPWLNQYGSAYASDLFIENDDEMGMGVNYFDDPGVFIAVFYWSPLAAQVLWLLARLVWRAVRLMAAVKRRQLLREAEAASKKRQ
ncbi:hypothetical protein STCU_10402 [Strigomonas culicis]|uniref:Uncharacterized protein n=1 Tax=Strigomonas culicis TaxID=28005 RepID=S9TI78_9TRYP|nr:hypothetical protein STCU_10402 [Strigomonas culicis]|eukprot:EPY17787.1 hypothetical protein STCU_10402 [Strigomonas culicis]